MKVRNKKTGQIGFLRYIHNGEFIIEDINATTNCEYIDKCHSLAELYEKWGDYEEPKEEFYIKANGIIDTCGAIEDDVPDEMLSEMKQIGNDFETKEEAEKAVEKLKAWKRLKDKGFRFDGYDVAHNSNGDLCGQLFYNAGDYGIADVEKDLDLLFGDDE